jgi:hypothetical protein
LKSVGEEPSEVSEGGEELGSFRDIFRQRKVSGKRIDGRVAKVSAESLSPKKEAL